MIWNWLLISRWMITFTIPSVLKVIWLCLCKVSVQTICRFLTISTLLSNDVHAWNVYLWWSEVFVWHLEIVFVFSVCDNQWLHEMIWNWLLIR